MSPRGALQPCPTSEHSPCWCVGYVCQVCDAWYSFRSELQYQYVDSLEFMVQEGDYKGAWISAKMYDEAALEKSFHISVNISTLGSHLLHIRVCYKDDQDKKACNAVEQSPTIVQVL